MVNFWRSLYVFCWTCLRIADHDSSTENCSEHRSVVLKMQNCGEETTCRVEHELHKLDTPYNQIIGSFIERSLEYRKFRHPLTSCLPERTVGTTARSYLYRMRWIYLSSLWVGQWYALAYHFVPSTPVQSIEVVPFSYDWRLLWSNNVHMNVILLLGMKEKKM